MQPRSLLWCFVSLFLTLALTTRLVADPWPTYRADANRGGVSQEELATPLHLEWTYQPQHGPRHAWPRTFRENAWTGQKIRSVLTFDHAFHTAAADGRVYFGSSADHKIYCLDATTGQEQWHFFTEGPVRMSPTLAGGDLFAGSDDGFVYCLNAATGELKWKHRVGPNGDRLPGNEQWISRWPIRSGIVVKDNIAYCAAGLFPHREGCYLCAVDASTGRQVFKHKINQVTQGYLLASDTRLYVPAGKLAPSVYDRQTGEFVSSVSTPRGTFALISDNVFLAGPSVGGGEIGAVAAENTNDRLATFPGNEMIVHNDLIYMLSDTSLHAVSRAELARPKVVRRRKEVEAGLGREETPAAEAAATLQQELAALDQQLATLDTAAEAAATWKRDIPQNLALILAGDLLIAGGDGSVAAIRTADGEEAWTAEVDGRALGLAVADGKLLVSTDQGTIHCFGTTPTSARAVVGHKTSPPATSPDAIDAETARELVAAAPQKQGYCLVIGCGTGRLVEAIAQAGQLFVVGVERDALKVAAARDRLDRAGLYGTRAVVHHAPADRIPYGNYLFNLIVSDTTIRTGELPSAKEVSRLLRPFGLAMIGQPAGADDDSLTADALEAWVATTPFGNTRVTNTPLGRWARIERGRLPGSGDWTHQYANGGNTANSADELVNSDLKLHWFGRPGPYRMFDRHSFTASPVAVHGRLFTLGEHVLYGNDAYNGLLLWTAELPELEPRVNLPRDCGFMAANQNFVFLAAGPQCLKLDVATGERLAPLELPGDQLEAAFDWGYVAIDNGLLFGSSVRQGTFYAEGRGPWYDDSSLGKEEHSQKVLSEKLFAVSQDRGRLRWQYDGIIINSTITLGGGRLYFVENRHPDIRLNPEQRQQNDALWKELVLVALDAESGEKLWERPLKFEARDVVFYLAYQDEVLISVRSAEEFTVTARDAETGSDLWDQSHGWLRTHHGSHRRHPVIMQDVVFQQPYAYDLRTGEEKWKIEENGACGTLSGSGSLLFCRVNYPRMYDLSNDAQPDNLVEVTRPGCWINIIPAGGLVLMPEAGSGCSCSFPLHATMAFLPTAQETE